MDTFRPSSIIPSPVLRGTQFKEKFPKACFFTLSSANECDNEINIRNGLVTDKQYNPNKLFGRGLYFYDYDNVYKYINLTGCQTMYIREVIIVDNSSIVECKSDCHSKYKTSSFYLKQRLPIEMFYGWVSVNYCKQALLYNIYLTQFIKVYDEELFRFIVTKCGTMIKYIENPSEEICTIAIQQTPLALEFVENQTEDMCRSCIYRYGLALEYVKKQTEELCCIALMNNPKALKFIINKTDELCMYAIIKMPYTIKYIENPSMEMCIEAITRHPSSIQYIRKQTDEMCFLALEKDVFTLKFIHKQTEEMCIFAISQAPVTYHFIKNKTLSIKRKMIEFHGVIYEHIPKALSKEIFVNDLV